MTTECKKRLRIIKYDGSSKHSQMAEKLLKKNIEFTKIVDLAKTFDSSVSSVHRFITKMGFPSFKHFKYEYNADGYNDDTINTPQAEYLKEIEGIIERTRGKFWILPSRRGRAIAKFAEERLKDGHVDCEVYEESNNNLREFVNSIPKEDTIFIIDITGHSYIVGNAIAQLAEIPNAKRPSVIILTAAQWMKLFSKYKFIHVAKFLSSHFEDISRWDDYNYIMIRLMPVVSEILNAIGKSKGVC